MEIEELLKDYFQRNSNPGPEFWQVLSELVDSKAAEQDHRVNQGLLRDLILNYSLAGRRLVELDEQKNKFLGIAAHDLRSPLSSIRGISEILLAQDFGPLTEEQKEFVDTIHNASENMLNLVNTLLDVAVIESGKLKLRIVLGSMKALLEERMRFSRGVAEKKEISLNGELGEVQDVQFDPNRMSQVLDNLLSNAIKFSPPGSHVRVKLVREDAVVKVSVRDQGPGISVEDQAKLFGTFQELSARPTRGERSVGLGLAIVKKIVEAHRGTLQVESQVGLGSTFSFSIPLEGHGDG